MIYSLEAEEAVLSAVLLGLAAATDTGLEVQHFATGQHQEIWSACLELEKRSVTADMITVGDRMGDDQGVDYITALTESGQGVADVGAYAGIIIDKWQRRVIADQASAAAQDAETCDLEELRQRVDGITGQLDTGTDEFAVDHATAIKQTLGNIDERQKNGGKLIGLSTGSRDLDRMTNGLRDGHLWIVAGRPGMGKSVAMCNFVEAACNDVPTAIFSMEMPRDDLIERMISSLGSVDYGRLVSGGLEGNDWHGLTTAVARMKDWNLRIDDRGGLTPGQIDAACKRYKREMGGLGLIMVDYLQLANGGKQDSRANEVGFIAKELKNIAKKYGCPVVALAQLNRGVESRQDKRPVLSDLKESGGIEENADVVILLYREEYYDENTDKQGEAEFIIAKQRAGKKGTITRSFIGRNQKFVDIYRGDV